MGFALFTWGDSSKQKNIDDILHAMATVQAVVEDISLTIVGDGPEMDMLKNCVSDLDLNKSVNFMGSVPHSEIGTIPLTRMRSSLRENGRLGG